MVRSANAEMAAREPVGTRGISHVLASLIALGAMLPMQDAMPTDELRAFVWEKCAMPKERCPLNVRVVGRIEYDDYVLVKLIYDAEPSSSVPAHLYVPRGVEFPVPAIVLAHGHGGSKSVFFNQYAGQLYAKAGIAVLSSDPLGEEERDPEARLGTRGHDRAAEEAQSLGRPVMGKMVWDLIRGIDYLETRPEIDRERIGVVGHSLGAIVGMYLAALDDRIKVAVPAAMYFIPPRKQKFCTRGMYELIEERVGYPTLLAMAADRCPTLIPVGDDDPVCGGREVQETGFQEFFRSASALFAQAGAPDGLARHIYPDAGHRAYFLNKEALLWLEQHVGLPRITADEIRALPEINMSAWADANGVKFERLYGTEQHYAGHDVPDVGVRFVQPEELACLTDEERRGPMFTIAGWLEAARRQRSD
jgi:dienelactone hydrolase